MFLGHQKNWSHLLTDIKNNRLPPAYLFYGLPGIGKQKVAETIVQYLFCSSKLSLLPCGHCSQCVRVQNHQHPDFFYISAQEKKIKIDDIRQLQTQLSMAPLEVSYKGVVINDAHELTLQAANALLKTLEEPPPQTLFILVAPNLFTLLPTLRSRSRRLYFSSPPLEESAKFIQQKIEMPFQEIAKLLQITEGSIGMVLEVLSEEFVEASNKMRQLLEAESRSFVEMSSLAASLASSEMDLEFLLEVIKKEKFKKLVEENRLHELDQIGKWTEAQKDLARNGNKQLVLENLFMSTHAT